MITPVVDNTTIGITETDDVELQLSGGRFFEKTPFSGTLSSKDQNYLQTSMTRYYDNVGEISIYLDKTAQKIVYAKETCNTCLLYTSQSPRDKRQSRMPSSA